MGFSSGFISKCHRFCLLLHFLFVAMTLKISMYELSEGEVATDMGWEWAKSDTVWLEDDVSSEITHFPPGFWVSSCTKIFHLECVTGLPSQIPITVEATAFLINLTNIPNFGDETVDAILKDQVHILLKYMQR
ncbi:hypothetical protein DFH07DRAFT_783099 [Mycena maculata]|uniref:Uncharacterized protein n=1 Tax=Mycena maculata TaxID=230809 RepID=A0AAD7HQG1_9AGAR|nr:hypothetical protein DFH07DRAFT_783099 [Mycena maculata]